MSYTNLLTIAMPCYERTEYFLDALESALKQTVKCEVIVVDNCSSHDYYRKICQQKNVTYYRNETNIGLLANFARGVELADTEYVIALQDDDVLAPDYVEAFVEAVTRYPDIDVFFSNYEKLTAKGLSRHEYTLPYGYMKPGTKIIKYGIEYELGFPYMSCAIKRDKAYRVEEVKGWGGGFDWVWIYSVADQLTFYGDERVLYRYRIHDTQVSQKDRMSFTVTVPFIYDEILPAKITSTKWRKKAAKKAFWVLIHLKSYSGKHEIDSFMREKNVYTAYLQRKLTENRFLGFLYGMHRMVASSLFFCYRIVNLLNRKTHSLFP